MNPMLVCMIVLIRNIAGWKNYKQVQRKRHQNAQKRSVECPLRRGIEYACFLASKESLLSPKLMHSTTSYSFYISPTPNMFYPPLQSFRPFPRIPLLTPFDRPDFSEIGDFDGIVRQLIPKYSQIRLITRTAQLAYTMAAKTK